METMFVLNEDQRAILAAVARFARDDVASRAAKLDAHQDPLDGHSPESVEKTHAPGIRTLFPNAAKIILRTC